MTEDRVSTSLTIEAFPDKVWRILTTDRSAWWPEMEFDAAPGAPLVETWVENGVSLQAQGAVTAAEPPHLLAFQWTEPSWTRDLTVRVRLVAVGENTEVTITEQGFVSAGTPPTLPSQHEAGWRHHLQELRKAVLGGD